MMGLMNMLAQAAPPRIELTAAGAIIMSVSILGVLSLSAFCLARILREKRPSQHHHAPLDIDTRDRVD